MEDVPTRRTTRDGDMGQEWAEEEEQGHIPIVMSLGPDDANIDIVGATDDDSCQVSAFPLLPNLPFPFNRQGREGGGVVEESDATATGSMASMMTKTTRDLLTDEVHTLLTSYPPPSLSHVRAYHEAFPHVATPTESNGMNTTLHTAVELSPFITLDFMRYLLDAWPASVRAKERTSALKLDLRWDVDFVQFLVDSYPQALSERDELGYIPLY